MRIRVIHADEKPIEEAHGGTGSRRLYIGDKASPSERIQGMTHGWLPAGGIFDWHDHEGIEELMYVLKGEGTVEDEQGVYNYKPETVCVFPAGEKHKITNTSPETNEFIFIRTYE